MTKTDRFAIQRSSLNGFLFAEVGTEPSGMALSVLSTFARAGKDPWQEAASLAELSRPAAIDALAQAIAGLPPGLWSPAEATAIAGRLVALLPKAAVSVASRPLSFNQERRGAYVLVATLIATGILGFMLSHDLQHQQPDAVISQPPAIGTSP